MADSDGIGVDGSEGPADADSEEPGDAEEGKPDEEGVGPMSCLSPNDDPPGSLSDLPGDLEGSDPNELEEPDPRDPDDEDGPPGFEAVCSVAGFLVPCSKDFDPELA